MTTSIGALVLIMLVAMLSPGPDLILVLKNSRFGFRQGSATALGISSGLVVHCILALAGVAVLLTTSKALYLLVRLGGALYLIYLGIRILTALFMGNQTLVRVNLKSESVTARRCYLEGLVTNILNPKVTIFILSIFTQFISPQAPLSARALVAGVLLLECVIFWTLLGAFIQLRGFQNLLLRIGKYIDAVFGLALVGLGVKIALHER